MFFKQAQNLNGNSLKHDGNEYNFFRTKNKILSLVWKDIFLLISMNVGYMIRLFTKTYFCSYLLS